MVYNREYLEYREMFYKAGEWNIDYYSIIAYRQILHILYHIMHLNYIRSTDANFLVTRDVTVLWVNATMT